MSRELSHALPPVHARAPSPADVFEAGIECPARSSPIAGWAYWKIATSLHAALLEEYGNGARSPAGARRGLGCGALGSSEHPIRDRVRTGPPEVESIPGFQAVLYSAGEVDRFRPGRPLLRPLRPNGARRAVLGRGGPPSRRTSARAHVRDGADLARPPARRVRTHLR
jgi:hypothetical protein